MSYQGLPDALCWEENRYITLVSYWLCLWLLQDVFLVLLVSNLEHFTEIVQHYPNRHNILNILDLRVICFHNASPATLKVT